MLDIKFIRENKELIDLAIKKKRLKLEISVLLEADDKRRALLQSIEKKRAEQNEFSNQIDKVDPEAKPVLLGRMKELKDSLQKEDETLKEVMKTWQKLMLEVPNIPDMSVPDGDSDAENKEVKKWGEIPKLDFEPKNHIDLLEMHNMADFEKGAEVSGFRGYFLKNEGAVLEFALWQFTLEHFMMKGDFSPMIVPSLVRRETLLGTGYLPQGEEDLYHTQDNDYLAGTAEVATMAYFSDKVLNHKELPRKTIAFSPAFRREAGSHGKDTKGLVRVHEFYKFEQVVICEASHEVSVKLHESLLLNAEELMQALGIPYRVVVNCTGDLGLGQVKKYDIEAWVPSENKYRETHSCSYFHDFQTRRLNIKYKDETGKLRFAHSLNNTALATPRILVPLLENNQRADGSVAIPEVLQKYVGKNVIAKK